MRLKVRVKFPILFPYGILHSAKVLFSISMTIIFYFMELYINGTRVLEIFSWIFLSYTILSFLAHIIGLQLNMSDDPNRMSFIPLACFDFIFGCFGGCTYFIGIIICFKSLAIAHDVSNGLFVTYLFASFNCVILTIIYFLYTILLLCKSQSQCMCGIRKIIVEGNCVSYANLPDIKNIHISFESPKKTSNFKLAI